MLKIKLDLYKVRAAEKFNVEYDSVTPEQRDIAKRDFWFMLYGKGERLTCDEMIIKETFKNTVQDYAKLEQKYLALKVQELKP